MKNFFIFIIWALFMTTICWGCVKLVERGHYNEKERMKDAIREIRMEEKKENKQ